ncbi:MAG: endonuclease/exonuclease/phosphatase family protein [Chitinophagaceae bacterium]|nr:endonuclease/exonuclease/phosphatase family protein [Chitinophagaceae bacterium]
MKKVFGIIFLRIADLGTIAISLLYLASLTVPYIDNHKYWMVSVLALGFPFLLAGMVAATLFWVMLWSRRAWICLAVLLLGYQQIGAAIAFNMPKKFVVEKPQGTLRVMQWNVHNWNQIKFPGERELDDYAQPEMMNLIRRYDADILCLEEFFEGVNPKKYISNVEVLKAMGYRYYYFLNDGIHDRQYYAGIAVFSKFPVADGKSVEVATGININPVASAMVDVNGRQVRVFAVHLESVRFEQDDYQNLDKMKESRGREVNGGKVVLSKLRTGFVNRRSQAEAINREVESTTTPVIVCGDFNDVPNSRTYFTVRQNLNDAFISKGTFIGRTFRFISPTLRIDYILPSKDFKVEQCRVIRANYSDHYPVIADLRLN